MNQVVHGPESNSIRATTMIKIWWGASLFWWGLAFLPFPQDVPEWVKRAQTACFGTMTNGMPNAAGWIMLVIAPLSLLTGVYAIYGAEVRESMKLAKMSKAMKIFFSILILATVYEGVWIAKRIRNSYQLANVDYSSLQTGDFPNDYPKTAKPLPKFKLIDQLGKNINETSYKGKVVVLTYAFAHCEAICPLLVKNTVDALTKLDATKVEAIFITLDPRRDTPSSLPDLAREWSLPANAHIVSGAVAEVENALKELGVPYQRDEKTGDVAHPALVNIIGKEGNIVYSFNNPTVNWLVKAVQTLQ